MPSLDELNQPEGSAVETIAKQKALRAAEDAGRPLPSEAELDRIAAEAENVFGFDAQRDRHGNPIQQGIGAKGWETHNHLASIKKYEGVEAYNRELRRIWKETPDYARKMGFPDVPRVGA
jgi:hypothetical protein